MFWEDADRPKTDKVKERKIDVRREEIEWLNYWIEAANSEKKRILLIGDSVARQYRKTLNDILASRGYVVDLVATSYGMTDPLLYEELFHFINVVHYNYEAIVFQLGAHHGYDIECKNSKKDKELYEFHLRKILKMLANEKIQLITVAGTPEREIDEKGENIENHNGEICKRNEILSEISNQEKYVFIDLYEYMIKHKFEQVDLFHYVRSSDECIANRIAEILFGKPMKAIYNRLDSMVEFLNVLNKFKKIYIYGNAKRGKIIDKYLRIENMSGEGYIVSDEFSHMFENVYMLSSIKPDNDTVIIVTPTEYEIYSRLNEKGYQYISLTERIYTYLKEHVNIYENVH